MTPKAGWKCQGTIFFIFKTLTFKALEVKCSVWKQSQAFKYTIFFLFNCASVSLKVFKIISIDRKIMSRHTSVGGGQNSDKKCPVLFECPQSG